MERYQKETAQIHAPAALIEKTKAAMREEEERIRKEQAEQTFVSDGQAAGAGHAIYQSRSFDRSVRRWAYPLTAAAAVLILLSVSAAMRNVRSGDSMSGGAAVDGSSPMQEEGYEEAAKDWEYEDSDRAEAPAAGASKADMPELENAGSEDAAEECPAEGPASENAAAGSMAENSVSESPAADAGSDLAEESGISGSAEAQKKEMESKTSNSMEDTTRDGAGSTAGEAFTAEDSLLAADDGVTIEAVGEKPAFYDSPEAEDFVYAGESFRVVQEENGWAAYVETEKGKAYVIRAEAEDREAFLEKAYERLTKRTSSRFGK